MELTTEYQGRELLHSIKVLTRCLQLPRTNPACRRHWRARIRKARAELEALSAGGLDRSFGIRRKGLNAGPGPSA
jgi:hypothetical protein